MDLAVSLKDSFFENKEFIEDLNKQCKEELELLESMKTLAS